MAGLIDVEDILDEDLKGLVRLYLRTRRLTVRKRIVVCSLILLVCLANAGAVVNWLNAVGVLAWAQHVCDRYATGTAITVIAACIIVVLSKEIVAKCLSQCRVCGATLTRRGKYCSECGSRV